MAVCGVILLALFAGAAAADVTPIEKVISLIDGLKKEVESDGKGEAAAYDEFACFCKSTTGTKSKSVQSGTKKIGVLSADIADKTQEKADDSTELAKRKQDHEDLNLKLDEETTRHAKAKAAYELEAADLSKAIQGLKDAIKSMGDSKPSLLVIKQKLGKTLELAEAMSLLSLPKHKATASLIQQSAGVDPSDPEYKFHSQDILDLCNELLVDYKASKSDLDAEWKKTDEGCKQMKKSLNGKLTANKAAMEQLSKDIQRLAKEIAAHREDLIESESLMKDDEAYLKDLTARCEDRANDYDQRSAMRGSELAALTGALEVLSGKVEGRANAVNKRALLIQDPKAPAKPVAQKTAAPIAKKEVAVAPKPKASTETTKATKKAISLLQELSSNLRGGSQLSEQDRMSKALDALRSEGMRLNSVALTSLAERVAADPFKKVKGLIQKLIERLLAESQAEATKKGFCDTELGKARKDRDYRFQEAKDLSAEIMGLQAKRDELTQEIKQLKSDIKAETQALKETTKERKDEKEANAKTLKTAKEGLEGVTEALLILKSFYKQAAKASFVQASPVDEDTQGAGFSGNYKGKQGASSAIFALLETIQSDFDRTLRTTAESEHKAHREYVEYNQAAQASIAGKTTKQELDEADLKTTNTNLAQKKSDLETAVDLLDSALKELEELKPTCLDTGMSYSERVKKREEEMEALKRALCLLDGDNVEPECSGLM